MIYINKHPYRIYKYKECIDIWINTKMIQRRLFLLFKFIDNIFSPFSDRQTAYVIYKIYHIYIMHHFFSLFVYRFFQNAKS